MADIAANLDTEITTNGSRIRFAWHGGAKHLSASLDGILALPHHGNNRAVSKAKVPKKIMLVSSLKSLPERSASDVPRGHVSNEAREELLILQVDVVLFKVIFARGSQLHGNELEALGFKALDNFANDTSLDTIGLDHNV